MKWCKYITWLEFGAVSCQSCEANVKFMATRCANAESYGMLISVQEIIRARGGIMMENKSDKGGFWKRQSFLLPPLTAAVVLLCQQMASSNPSGVVTVNILLLVLNFFSYVGLLRGEKSTEKSVAIAAAGFITLMAFVFNTCVAGIPTPLSDTGIFMNSLCGMWVLVAVVQGISLLIQAVLQPTVEQETGASETNVWNRLQKSRGDS